MSRMFRSITSTWNVFCGCSYECTFCNARKAALTRFRHIPRYKDGFKPHLVGEELTRRFKPGQFIFVAYMGDISFASKGEIEGILERIKEFPATKFLFQTKNPDRYWQWNVDFPQNLYLGTTIETNRDYNLTKAPEPYERYVAMAELDHPHKFISIEPIMDFHLATLVDWIEEIKPEIIEIGADNYHNHLVEPPWWKVEKLFKNLGKICSKVIEKERLERLKGGS